MKKVIIVLMLVFLLALSSCKSGEQSKTSEAGEKTTTKEAKEAKETSKLSIKKEEAITLPYTIIDNITVDKLEGNYQKEGRGKLGDYLYIFDPPLELKQVLKEVTLRELTEEEEDKFLDEPDIIDMHLKLLNEKYKVLELYFGDIVVLRDFNYLLGLEEKKTAFYYNGQSIPGRIHQMRTFDEQKSISADNLKDDNDEVLGLGESNKNYKILVLVENSIIREGLQLRTKIGDDIVYIDVPYTSQ